MLFLEDPINEMAAEELDLDLAPQRDIIGYRLVRLGEGVANDQTVGLLDFRELIGFEEEVVLQLVDGVVLSHVVRDVVAAGLVVLLQLPVVLLYLLVGVAELAQDVQGDLVQAVLETDLLPGR